MSEINWVDKKSENNCWLTPSEVTKPIHAFFPYGFLDPCTESSNPTGAKVFYTKETNGLDKPWVIRAGIGPSCVGVYCNAPYSLTSEEREKKEKPPIRAWTAKIHHEASLRGIIRVGGNIYDYGDGLEILALLPCGARFSTKYFQTNVLSENLHVVLFFDHRIKFIDGRTGVPGKWNNYDSMLMGFNLGGDGISRFQKCFGHLGSCFETIKLG